MPDSFDRESRLFTSIYSALTARQEDTRAFRELADKGLPVATAIVGRENRRYVRDLVEDPSNDSLFKDKKRFLEMVGGVDGIGDRMTGAQTAAFRAAVDAASLVFMHSALDATATDLCRLSALIAPDEWMHWIKDMKVTLEEAAAVTPQLLVAAKLEAHLRNLERQSLLERIGRLFAVCKPTPGAQLVRGYAYDSDRLEELDELRHTVIHRAKGASVSISNCTDAIGFLFKTGLYLIVLVHEKHGVQLDPTYMFQPGTR